MIAQYGHKDDSGEYVIRIETDKCIACPVGYACVAACPMRMFEIITDDYDEDVAWIKPQSRKTLKHDCAGCKPAAGYKTLPCTRACTPGAIKHSW